MAAFTDLDWTRCDVDAIVNGRGVGVVEPLSADSCRSWLKAQGYVVEQLDCGAGVGPAVAHLGNRLRWEDQFGYSLDPASRNLDALRDGFLSEQWESNAFVLEVHHAELAWREDPRWFLGLLAIAQEHSLCRLALGHRFLTLLILEAASPLVGQTIETTSVRRPFWRPRS